MVAKQGFPAPSDVCFLVSGMFNNILTACGGARSDILVALPISVVLNFRISVTKDNSYSCIPEHSPNQSLITG